MLFWFFDEFSWALVSGEVDIVDCLGSFLGMGLRIYLFKVIILDFLGKILTLSMAWHLPSMFLNRDLSSVVWLLYWFIES